MNKFSVIIPCLNAEDTIDRCLESLERQTIGMENLDIIAIDDCSDDNTAYRLREWRQKHKNIRTFTSKKWSLPGRIRNDALDVARGKYIAFLDSDDWLDPDALEKIYNIAGEYGAEIVCFQYRACYDACIIDYTQGGRDGFLNTGSTEEEKISFYRKAGIRRCCWDKVYKREFVNNNRLRFAEGVIEEESLFTIPALIHAPSVYATHESLYNYFQNPKGCTNASVGNKTYSRDNEIVWMQVYERMREDGSLVTSHELAEWFFVINYYFYSLDLAEARQCPYSKAEKKKLSETVKRLFPDYMNNKALKATGYDLGQIGGDNDRYNSGSDHDNHMLNCGVYQHYRKKRQR